MQTFLHNSYPRCNWLSESRGPGAAEGRMVVEVASETGLAKVIGGYVGEVRRAIIFR